MSAADLRTEVALVKAQLGQAGVTTISPIYVYPGGNRNAATDAILAEYGFTGPHVGGNSSSDPNGLPWYGGAIYPYIWNYSCDAVSAAVCQAAIAHAFNYGESLAILYHINPTAQCDAACFRSTMDMLNAMHSGGQINLTTFDGVYRPTSGITRTPRP